MKRFRREGVVCANHLPRHHVECIHSGGCYCPMKQGRSRWRRILSISHEMKGIHLVAFMEYFYLDKKIRQNYPLKATKWIPSISNEMEKIQDR